MRFITSWDDGHPADQRLADLLNKYGLRGTFFIPINNQEGKPVISDNYKRIIDQEFEIGCHGYDHIYLNKLSARNSFQQIHDSKKRMEDILGHYVRGFCYPGGKKNLNIKKQVIDLGFHYARGTKNFYLESGSDIFDIPTTIQFFPHSRYVLTKNFISQGNYSDRSLAFLNFLKDDWLKNIYSLLELCAKKKLTFHLWGHSWEIEDNHMWENLENLFSFVSSLCPISATIDELIKKK